jgi:hypothetical protein
LASRNQKIKIQLTSLIDKEKQLENLLIFALKNFAPNFIIKNSDLKYFENILPEGQSTSTSNINPTNPILNPNNNQLIEINKSTFQKNDVLNKIFKEIKSLLQYYYIVKETPAECKEEDFKPIIPSITVPVKYSQAQPANKIEKKETEKNTSNVSNNIQLDTSEYMFNNQMRDFHNRFMNCLEDHNLNLQKMSSANSSSLNQPQMPSNVTKIYPRRTNSITIIENNPDYEVVEKSEDIKIENNQAGLFKIMSATSPVPMGKNSSFSTVVNSSSASTSQNSQSGQNVQTAQLLQNKRKRNLNQINTDVFYDAIHRIHF